jgi:ribosomal protein S18 acetylase RimI-like enzyme
MPYANDCQRSMVGAMPRPLRSTQPSSMTTNCAMFRLVLPVGTVTTRDAAHMAIAVVDACQGEGLGRRLLQALFNLAVERGVRAMHADVLATNAPMRRLLKRFDGIITIDNGDPSVVAYEIDTVAASSGQV